MIMKNHLTNFVKKYNYGIYIVCILMNIPGCILLNPVSLFATGWISGLLFCQLVNDDVI